MRKKNGLLSSSPDPSQHLLSSLVSLNTESEPNGGQFPVLAIHPLPDTCLQGLAISTRLMSVRVAGLDIRSEFMSAGFHVAVTQALLCNE